MQKRYQRRMMALRRFDANQDGWLSPDEQAAARAARTSAKARRSSNVTRDGGGGDGARWPAGR
jgi:hypothetical protein